MGEGGKMTSLASGDGDEGAQVLNANVGGDPLWVGSWTVASAVDDGAGDNDGAAPWAGGDETVAEGGGSGMAIINRFEDQDSKVFQTTERGRVLKYII